jgi:hypothetical protein
MGNGVWQYRNSTVPDVFSGTASLYHGRTPVPLVPLVWQYDVWHVHVLEYVHVDLVFEIMLYLYTFTMVPGIVVRTNGTDGTIIMVPVVQWYSSTYVHMYLNCCLLC